MGIKTVGDTNEYILDMFDEVDPPTISPPVTSFHHRISRAPSMAVDV